MSDAPQDISGSVAVSSPSRGHLRLVTPLPAQAAGPSRSFGELAGAIERTAAGGGTIFVDFDHTLLLANSTELFLDLARPRFLAALLLDIVDAIAPWRWFGEARETWRDPIRVAMLTCLMPLLSWRWRRQANAIVAKRINRPLATLLRAVPRTQIEIVSLGSQRLIAPLLEAAGLGGARLVASPTFVGATTLRREGKAAALIREHGAEHLARSCAITDSPADSDLLDAVGRPFLLLWPGDHRLVGQGRAYYPLRYTHRVKYPGKGIVRRQLIGEDLCVAFLAFGLSLEVGQWRSWPDMMVRLGTITLLWLSFHTVYELGYEENDLLGVRTEAKPTLSRHAAQAYSVAAAPWAWGWGLALGAGAVALWTLGLGLPARLGLALGLGWFGLLAWSRVLFSIFNHLPVQRRLYLFPALQLVKTFGYTVFMAASLPGALLGVAQVLRQTTNYAIYRYRGDNRSFRRQVHRLLVFVGMLAVLTVSTRDVAPWWAPQTWLILAYCGYRVGREHLRFAHFRVDARHADFLAGRTDVRPGEA